MVVQKIFTVSKMLTEFNKIVAVVWKMFTSLKIWSWWLEKLCTIKNEYIQVFKNCLRNINILVANCS
jgi:hypothetical protein